MAHIKKKKKVKKSIKKTQNTNRTSYTPHKNSSFLGVEACT